MSVETGDVIKMTVNCSMPNASSIQNVYYVRKESGASLSDSVALLDLLEVAQDLQQELDDVQVADLAYVSIDCYNITQDKPVGVQAMSGIGTLAQDPLPPGVAALVTLDTGQKRGKGRKYIGGLSEALTTGGEFNAATVLDLAAYATKLIGVFTGGTLDADWRIGLWREATSTFAPFISYLVNAIPAYQRRRKPGSGS